MTGDGETILRASDLLPEGAPRVGFGCGDLYSGEALAASIQLIEAALEAGIRWFDVARLYGDGSAEAVLGRVLPSVRDEVVIVSKAGIMPWSMLGWTRVQTKAARVLRRAGPLARRIIPEPPPARERHGMFSPRALEQSVERSLRALRTDHLDLFLLHECSVTEALAEETSRFLERLRSNGKARFVGVATGFGATAEILRQRPERFAAAQFPSDIFDRNAHALAAGWYGLTVNHSSLKHALPRFLAHFAADDDARRRWTLATGLNADAGTLGRVLLADAADANPDGIALFTTSRPERMAEAVSAAKVLPEILHALRTEAALCDTQDPSRPRSSIGTERSSLRAKTATARP